MTGTTSALTTTAGALQPTKTAGSAPYVAEAQSERNRDGVRDLSSAAARTTRARRIAVDAGGNAYVAGVARSSDFPTRNRFTSRA